MIRLHGSKMDTQRNNSKGKTINSWNKNETERQSFSKFTANLSSSKMHHDHFGWEKINKGSRCEGETNKIEEIDD